MTNIDIKKIIAAAILIVAFPFVLHLIGLIERKLFKTNRLLKALGPSDESKEMPRRRLLPFMILGILLIGLLEYQSACDEMGRASIFNWIK